MDKVLPRRTVGQAGLIFCFFFIKKKEKESKIDAVRKTNREVPPNIMRISQRSK